MSEWWTYRLTSFLLFSPRTYYRTIELYNLAIWPAQLAGMAIGVAIVVLLMTSIGQRGRIIAALLAAVFLHERVGPARSAGAVLVAAGIALLALG